MPGFYTSTQYRYLDQVKQKEDAKKAAKQIWRDGIRARAFEKKHVEIGVAKSRGPVTGVPKDYVAGNPKPKEQGVAEIFASWNEPLDGGPSAPPKYDKN